jgi:hypothetical protein
MYRSGLGEIDQALPFQTSIKVSPQPTSSYSVEPTATQYVVLAQETEYKKSRDPGMGTPTVFEEVPS